MQDVEIRLDQLGSVLLEFPPGYEDVKGHVTLFSASAPTSAAHMVSFSADSSKSQEPTVVVAGTYSAAVRVFGQSGWVALESDSFVVVPSGVTVVHLRPKRTMQVGVAAVHAETEEPIGLDVSFWIKINPIDVDSSERIGGTTSFTGGLGVCTGITWTLDVHNELVRIEVPENALWTFDPIEPLVLHDGLTITLRARPKAQ